MSMLRFLIQRALYSVFVLFGLSIVIFIIARIMPGDPARMAVGARAPQWVVDRLREQMHLDKPIAVQYYYWLRDALRGDFGISLITQRPVTSDIMETLPASLELALYAAVIAGVLGIGMGILSARYKDSWIDNLSRLFSYAGIVTPSYIFAILFVLLFGFTLKWFPIIGRVSEDVPLPPKITGLVTIDALLQGQFSTFLDALWHIVLPSLSLAMGSIAQAARITRSSMADNLTRDYIANLRALGVSERLIMSRFLLKPSLIPTVSILGLDIAAILSVAFIVESIFNWPGMARYGMNAMLYKDLNAISAVILVFGAAFALMNILVDLVVAYLDPRIRLRAAKGE
ncbi:MAG: ABC transporter permease [Anaerolineales bacterium]|nr:ABC transporter permease [Anaerolineales bacterium]MCS7248613.1 ABC transporter permease [Anaerolineales bacterium]MDW8162426.1 ABC transporter permease [Anaerolineales bacterium]MDW8446347.1 ABC transporter permease [Anaerolineales bacterium]